MVTYEAFNFVDDECLDSCRSSDISVTDKDRRFASIKILHTYTLRSIGFLIDKVDAITVAVFLGIASLVVDRWKLHRDVAQLFCSASHDFLFLSWDVVSCRFGKWQLNEIRVTSLQDKRNIKKLHPRHDMI